MTTLEQATTRGRLSLFMSYARADLEAVRMVQEGIETLRHQVWIDRRLDGGQDWWDEILARIRACDAMIIAVSPTLLESDAAAKERTYARQLGKPLLPVLVAPVITDLLPPDLASLQLVDYTQVTQLNAFQLAAALSRLRPPPPLPQPLPPAPVVPVSYLTGLADQVRAPTLSLEDQLSLVAVLRVSLRRPREHDAALELLRTLHRRRDLYYATWHELGKLLQSEQERVSGETPVAGPPREAVTTPPGWYPDPSRRHQFRWFDGDWTHYASDYGSVVEDPDF
ncbi:TIR domain-containing protein [Geodermatophilus maliterrae]|uniref:TIR domain-containing protein n=1 Tax=Geodermatophilus maliterrae TaxID=3162531 RepID=A0ABV3XEJ3_9ACTN